MRSVADDRLLLWGHDSLERLFEDGLVGGDMSVGTQLSMKAPVYGRDFPPRPIEQSIHTTSEE